jgi:hypothetical protein
MAAANVAARARWRESPTLMRTGKRRSAAVMISLIRQTGFFILSKRKGESRRRYSAPNAPQPHPGAAPVGGSNL